MSFLRYLETKKESKQSNLEQRQIDTNKRHWINLPVYRNVSWLLQTREVPYNKRKEIEDLLDLLTSAQTFLEERLTRTDNAIYITGMTGSFIAACLQAGEILAAKLGSSAIDNDRIGFTTAAIAVEYLTVLIMGFCKRMRLSSNNFRNETIKSIEVLDAFNPANRKAEKSSSLLRRRKDAHTVVQINNTPGGTIKLPVKGHLRWFIEARRIPADDAGKINLALKLKQAEADLNRRINRLDDSIFYTKLVSASIISYLLLADQATEGLTTSNSSLTVNTTLTSGNSTNTVGLNIEKSQSQPSEISIGISATITFLLLLVGFIIGIERLMRSNSIDMHEVAVKSSKKLDPQLPPIPPANSRGLN